MNRFENNSTNDKPLTARQVEMMLREAAFVLKLTAQVKAEMLRDRPAKQERPVVNPHTVSRPHFGNAV